MVFSNFDVEAILIDELRRKDPTALRWNFSGFGSNDPGHNRETREPAEFEKERPVDIDRPMTFLPRDTMVGALDLLVAIKDGLPYLFRYETDTNEEGRTKRHSVGHVDQREAAPITCPSAPITMREALRLSLEVLPNSWRATVFPDRVILYREKVDYRYAREYLEG